MHLGVLGGGVHRTVAQDIGDQFEVSSPLMRECSPALPQNVRPSGLDAAAAKGPPDDMAHPIREQWPAAGRPQADKEQALGNPWAASLQVCYQSSRDSEGQG
jgi:hypothetical protein